MIDDGGGVPSWRARIVERLVVPMMHFYNLHVNVITSLDRIPQISLIGSIIGTVDNIKGKTFEIYGWSWTHLWDVISTPLAQFSYSPANLRAHSMRYRVFRSLREFHHHLVQYYHFPRRSLQHYDSVHPLLVLDSEYRVYRRP